MLNLFLKAIGKPLETLTENDIKIIEDIVNEFKAELEREQVSLYDDAFSLTSSVLERNIGLSN